MKKFVAAYSGGKDSALAVHRAMQAGSEPVALIVMYNPAEGRSWFHGIAPEVLALLEQCTGIPVWAVETTGVDYGERLEEALARGRALGADSCVFGDIDVEGHYEWNLKRCESVGLKMNLPLWQLLRGDAVAAFLREGFTAHLTVADTRILPADMAGQRLTEELLLRIAATGADICGENGEYHTLVTDGPFFTRPLPVSFGERLTHGDYAVCRVRVTGD